MVLLGVGAYAAAQSLGSARSEVWIGKPLEFTVPARFASADARDECVEADVFYGDTRLPAGRVRATVLGAGADKRVRIEADPVVDEPIVTVTVRAGCRNTVSRNYTLLPELPSGRMLADAGVQQHPLQPATVLAAAAATQAAGAPPARPLALRTAAANRVSEPVPSRVRVARARPAPRLQEDTGSRPRLRLDLLEPMEPQTLLRVSASLTEPGQDAARRATAALLWQALNADPSELIRTSARVQALEGELAQLRQVAGQTRAEIAALRARMEAPEPRFFSTQAAQLLALLLLVASGIAGFLWWRSARNAPAVGQWYAPPADAAADSQLPPQQPGVLERSAANEPFASSAVAELAPLRVDEPAPRAEPVLPELTVIAPTPASPAVQKGTIDFEPTPLPAAATPVAARRPAETVLRVETLAATFEEVEFLTSLGLWTDARDVLKAYLEDSSEPSPVAFFELMRLCVHTDDATSLDAVRRRYRQVFGVEAPKFERINAPLGLESNADLAEEIIRSWGRPEALPIIEHHLFDVPQPTRAFSLQAGRDLLTLHDLAMTLLRESSAANATGTDADGHALAPWANAEDPAQAAAAAADYTVSGHRFALDLDLDVAAEPIQVHDSKVDELTPEVEADVASLLAEFDAAAEREEAARAAAERARQEEEDLFSAAVANESMRRPMKR